MAEKRKILVVVDMQNDFITGTLGTKEAEAIVPKVCEKLREFDGQVYFGQTSRFLGRYRVLPWETRSAKVR